MALTKEDKKYINNSINKSHKKFQRDTERYLGILREDFQDQMKFVIEMVQDRPTREEFNCRFDEIKDEIRLIRSDLAVHDVRIGHLEKNQ